MIRTRIRAVSTALVAAGVVAAAALVPAAANAAPTPVEVDVAASSISPVRPATGGWFVDDSGSAATFAVATDGPGNEAAMRMDLLTTSDKVYFYNTFGPGSRPVDIPALLDGANYDYAGINVNFQIEVIFEPTDVAAYGPAGSVKACTPAATWYGWGLTADPDWCYTILKWEPYVRPGTAAWTHVDLSVDTAALSSASQGGWVSSKNAGQYPGNVSVGQLMATYLDEMADYEVTSFAFGVGSGTPGPAVGYLKQYTVGGSSYGFVPEPTAPAPAPAADADALDDLIATQGIDVEADTAQFTGTDLNVVDPTAPFSGSFASWADPTDAFVDVYSYSTPVHLGTFPVVGGNVVLTGVDLAHLDPGAHRLLFRGQTSGTFAVVQFTVIGLAATGVDAATVPLGLGLAGVLLVAGVVLRRRVTV